jgi:hypothetical protein
LFSLTSALVFTLVFAVTGGYALVRFALITADGGGGDRLVELSHLLMSVAMVAMTWGAGTGRLAKALQIAVFAGLGMWFLARATLVTGGTGHGRLPDTDHAVTAAAMVWMVAAMPLIMGTSMAGMSDGASGGHAGHGGGAAGDGGMPGVGEMDGAAATTPTWVLAVSVAFVVLLVAGAVFWAVRAWRGGAEPEPVAQLAGTGAAGGIAVAVRTRAVGGRTGLAALTGARRDALCHLLMSAGMAGMLLAML